MKHTYQVGTYIKLKPDTYDGTTSSGGLIMALTRDDGTPTYRVQFDDGAIENHIYETEIQLSKESEQ